MKQTLKYIYDKLIENVKYAEGKHSIILALASAVIAFATTFFSDNLYQNLFATACLLFSLISIIYCFCALSAKNPKVRHKKFPKHSNLLSYKTIITHDQNTYIKALKEQYAFLKEEKPDQFDKDMAEQIISVSKSINLKFEYFNFAIVFLVLSILCGIMAVVIRGNVFW